MTESRRLRHGNLALDLATLPRCGARTRAGTPCRRAGTKCNGRCRLHGGASTGPRTIEGRRRVLAANITHGAATAGIRAIRRTARAMLRRPDPLAAPVADSTHAGADRFRPPRRPGTRRRRGTGPGFSPALRRLTRAALGAFYPELGLAPPRGAFQVRFRRARPETLAEVMQATLADAARREKRHGLTVQGVGVRIFLGAEPMPAR